jgi:hypothetical protein
MLKVKLAKLRINVLPTDESMDLEQLNEFSRQLYQELQESNADEVKLISAGDSPKGAKGVEGLVAEVAVAFVAHYAPEIIELIRHWVKRSPERKVRLTSSISGKEVQVVISSNDLKTDDVNKIVGSLLASFG